MINTTMVIWKTGFVKIIRSEIVSHRQINIAYKIGIIHNGRGLLSPCLFT